MSVVILTPPAASTVPIDTTDWGALQLIWEGFDGSVWDLNDYLGGVLLYRAGVEGLHFPKITKYRSRSRAIPGDRLRGWRAEARDVFWPTFIWGDGTTEWLERNNAFMSTIHPELPGTWRVRAGSQERTLQLTGVFDDPHAFDFDPLQRGWAKYGITLEASRPFWRGKKIQRGPWKAPDPAAFFPGPPFTISSGSAFGTATVPNPGDVEAWGVWTAVGPLESIELGVGSAIITVPFDVASGDQLVIDTDPTNPTAVLGPVPPDDDEPFTGTDVTADLGLQDYAAVPPGGSVPLHVEAIGAGFVTFELEPLHFRAF